ncbi:glycosyltransferase [Myxosarcina sp. GI1]|uniref:glycosyltransferase family protein n=1 Tax=Myxosarcina sp. GI1 TaxID=1541065 RepID=UPI00055A1297|nr:glycosyltransferase [Myxosarcina sp. GI1]
MNNHIINNTQNSRIAILSERELNDHVASCCIYEFEDAIAKYDRVDFFTPKYSYQSAHRNFKWVKKFSRSPQLANRVKFDRNSFTLEHDYELFFMVLDNPSKFIALNSIKNWRQKCQKAVCYIIEIWETQIPQWKPILELFKDFDHIFLGHASSIKAVEEITGVPCSYLPFATDAIKFSPNSIDSPRGIDVTNIGRRSVVTHQALLERMEEGDFFYYYDTPRDFYIQKPQEHRTLLANVAKNSRYWITNNPNFNADPREKKGLQKELGYRIFEGTAGGAVAIGNQTATEEFKKHFDWEDAVITIPADAADIIDIIAQLDTQSDRLEKIRRHNVTNSLLRHDWVYRWRQILESVGLEVTLEVILREAQLRERAERFTPSRVLSHAA